MRSNHITNRFASKHDFRTPEYIFEGICKHLGNGFHLDVASSNENKLCNWNFTEEDSAFDQKWWGRVWCNPPYNNIGPWVDKAITELDAGNCISVTFLIPASTCTFWFERLWARASQIVFLSGRIRFQGPHIHEEVKRANATNPSVVVHLVARHHECQPFDTKPNVSMVNIRNGVWG